MIRTLIVEDIRKLAEALQELLEENFSDIEVLEVCDSVQSTLVAIEKHDPELVFMDVELLGNENAFDILRRLASINFKIIFTTGYNKYAIDAIKFSALDYLLKPIDIDELRTAVQKFVANRVTTSPAQHRALIDYQPDNQQNRIGLPEMDGLVFVPVADIAYCKGESSQTSVHLKDGKVHLISRTLKDCADMLEGIDFCRVHKSYLINLQHVIKYSRGAGGYVHLVNGEHVNVSKNYKEELLGRLRKL